MSRVLVLGNACLDVSLGLPHLPVSGETLVATHSARSPGGKGLSQAVVAARVGIAVLFCTCLGDDQDGREITAALACEPLAFEACPAGECTDLSMVMVSADGENCVVTRGACADALAPKEAARFAAGAGSGDLLLMQGNFSRAATEAAAMAAIRGGARFMLNAAPLRWETASLLPFCTVLVANEIEARAMTGAEGSTAAEVLHGRGAAIAVVTLGAAGCVVADADGTRSIPAVPACVVDTTGAGDTFCGVLAALLAAGCGVDRALHTAVSAAALTVSRPGAFAALPSAAELTSQTGAQSGTDQMLIWSPAGSRGLRLG